MIIRHERKEDHAAIYEVNKLAFPSESEAQLVTAIRKLDDFIPELSLVAIKNKQVVGHILFSQISIEANYNSVPALALAPVAVRPEFQNQKIGSKLIKQGLKECKQLGHETVVVLGSPQYYRRFGFKNAKKKGIKAPFKVPDEDFMVIELVDKALDGVEGTVKYSKAFNECI